MEIKDKELHKIAITAIVYNDEGKYLISQRSLEENHFPGMWTVPGGKLTTDDYVHEPVTHPGDGANQWYYSLTSALKREVKEEVGIEIGNPEYLLDLTFVKGNGTPVLVLSYFAKYLSGDVILGEDTIDYKWVTVEDLPKYNLIKGIDREIEEVDAILKKRKTR